MTIVAFPSTTRIDSHTLVEQHGRRCPLRDGPLQHPHPLVLLMDGRPPERPRRGPKRSIRSSIRIDMISPSHRDLQVRRPLASTRLVAIPSYLPIDSRIKAAKITSPVADRAGSIGRVARNLNTFDASSNVWKARLQPKQGRIGQLSSRWDGRTRRPCW